MLRAAAPRRRGAQQLLAAAAGSRASDRGGGVSSSDKTASRTRIEEHYQVSSIDEKSKQCVVVQSRACKCVSYLKETNEVLECQPRELEGLKTERILS